MTINIKKVGLNTLLAQDRDQTNPLHSTKTEPTFGQIGWLRGLSDDDLDFTRPSAYTTPEGDFHPRYTKITVTWKPGPKFYTPLPLEQLKDEVNHDNLAWYARTLRRDEKYWQRQYDIAMYGVGV